MTTRILTIESVVTIAVLTTAAVSPKTTYCLLAKPYRLIEARKAANSQKKSRARFAEIQRLADQGDAASMFIVGTMIRSPGSEELTGVMTDSSAGVALIRAAAELDHVDAMVWDWSMNDGSSEGLTRLADRVLKLQKERKVLAGLADLARTVAIGDCDVALRDAADLLYTAALVGDRTEPYSDVAELSPTEEFMAEFQAQCGSS